MGTTIRIITISGITVLVVICMRLFLFSSFSIPTASMQPTLLPGDFVLVNKLIPGPRVDWPFGRACREKGCSLRLRGFDGIKRQDIIVFNAPNHLSGKIEKNWGIYYIKRCMGAPGDTLYIKKDAYWIKNNLGAFKIPVPTNKSVDDWMDTHKPEMFKGLDWTLTAFGPVYIPQEGDEIVLDSMNIPIYKNLIEYETGREISFSDNTCYLDRQPYPHHAFKQNYYFMAGDYAVDSEDSRYWGLLPEDHIVGKAAYIWRSTNPNTKKYRFDRFLKPL